ncbi:MAG: hypothetical protein II563_00745 [Treponema sp.]|nr:hypothetical protein [Treponema sp.]
MQIQSEFSNSTEFLIRRKFALPDEETIISCVWLKGGKTGFVFTDDGIYWNAKYSVSTEGIQTAAKEIEKIKKDAADDFQADILYKKKNSETGRKYSYDDTNATPEFLQLKNWQDKFRIEISMLDSNDAKILRRIFLDYISRGKFPYEYMDQTPLDTMSFMFSNAKDYFTAKKLGFKDTAEENPEDEDDAYPVDKRTEFFSSGGEIKDIRTYFSASLRKKTASGLVARNLMRYIVDVIADLIYAAAIFIAVKPMLVYQTAASSSNEVSNLFVTIGRFFLQFDSKVINSMSEIDWDEMKLSQIVQTRAFVFALLLFFFVILKIIIINCCAKGAKKIFPVTILIASLPVSMLAPNHFFFFIIIIAFLYVLMQFALNLDWLNIGFKLPAFVILIFILYYVVHLFGFPNFAGYMGAVMQMMDLKAQWF